MIPDEVFAFRITKRESFLLLGLPAEKLDAIEASGEAEYLNAPITCYSNDEHFIENSAGYAAYLEYRNSV